MNMTRTQWFENDLKPVHIGMYERKYGTTNLNRGLWNGREFVQPDGEAYGIQDCEWRGLADKSKDK